MFDILQLWEECEKSRATLNYGLRTHLRAGRHGHGYVIFKVIGWKS